MKFISGCINFIDKLNQKIGTAVSWISFALVLLVCYDVFTRYFLNKSIVAVQELEWHLFAIMFLIAAAYTLQVDEHVRVDVIYTRFNEKQKAWVNLIGSILFLIPFSIMVIVASKNFVIQSFLINETSPDAGGLPVRYILKAVLPISFFLLLLQGLSLSFRSYLKIKEINQENKA